MPEHNPYNLKPGDKIRFKKDALNIDIEGKNIKDYHATWLAEYKKLKNKVLIFESYRIYHDNKSIVISSDGFTDSNWWYIGWFEPAIKEPAIKDRSMTFKSRSLAFTDLEYGEMVTNKANIDTNVVQAVLDGADVTELCVFLTNEASRNEEITDIMKLNIPKENALDFADKLQLLISFIKENFKEEKNPNRVIKVK